MEKKGNWSWPQDEMQRLLIMITGVETNQQILIRRLIDSHPFFFVVRKKRKENCPL